MVRQSHYIKQMDLFVHSFSENLSEYIASNLIYLFSGGWVHGVSFSASGNKLAWVGHDSSISVVNAANECKMATIKGDFLPFMDCVWVTENSIITAGKMSSFKELLN